VERRYSCWCSPKYGAGSHSLIREAEPAVKAAELQNLKYHKHLQYDNLNPNQNTTSTFFADQLSNPFTMPSVGPQLPPHLAKRKRSIDDDKDLNSPPQKVQAAQLPQTLGPTLPPPRNPDELEVDSESDDGYGPSLGPSQPTMKVPSLPAKRAIGPAPPP
jgi:hypothetical protein